MHDVKKSAVCAAWIAGLLCSGWLLWFFTGPPRDRRLERQVNRILLSREEPFSVKTIPRRRKQRVGMGSEFALESRAPGGEQGAAGGTFLVFPLVSGGAALSCGALIDPQGRVERIIPLGAHAEQAFGRLGGNILEIYTRRIEGEGTL
jgi:hypothetical protein